MGDCGRKGLDMIHIGCHLSTTDGYEAISLSMYHTVFDSMDKDGFMVEISNNALPTIEEPCRI